MKKLLPILMLLVGSGAGVGAGVFFRPDAAPVEKADVEDTPADEVEKSDEPEKDGLPTQGKEYIKLSNQFVVPLVENERIASMVVMTLSVEIPEGQGQAVYDIEPKIRDEFLRVLFDHAAIGSFRGAFLTNQNLDTIRTSLRDVAFKTFGKDLISDVLIFEIARQDY
ncbi:flagellar basal body-associated FliL family protein [Roseobacter weihaiensis]|uniref:flagellar basal body-associated FliL family protein n=1 Tax=Roseobacter weihaiensis TaxID=2763262 RepID=UPI001D0B1AA3|nr:flagellar basal body-associated protein FliL [Roseobacter sp. H9]